MLITLHDYTADWRPNMSTIGGACRVSAISVMFEGQKYRESSALTEDGARIPDVRKDFRMKHERWK
jgi:hypothetical protein